MAELIQLICSACKKSYRLKKLIPGRVPPCKACKGPLRLPAKAILACPSCHQKSEAVEVDLQKPFACDGCGVPMVAVQTVVETEEETMFLTPSRAPAEEKEPSKADSLGLRPLDSADGAIRDEKFGKYEIVKELARGGMGIVYLVRDPRLRRTLALKVLIAGEGASEESIRRFLREARAAARLPNPHVINIHEVGEVSGQFYFTMDYVEGTDLGEAIDESKYSQRELLRCLIDVCGALHDAHQKGIIHRDLKPQNILIDRDKQAFVTDFGLAKDVTSQSIQSMTGTILGTPAYMSPEQAQGRTRAISERSDIYSMGVILYEVVTRQRPFEGATVFDTIDAVINKEPMAPREIEPDLGLDLNTVILKCIEKEPDRRYRTMRELQVDLKRFLAGKPVKARPLTRQERWSRQIRKRPKLVAGLIAAPVLILTIALTWWFVSGRGFWREVESAIASGDPSQMAAALSMLEQRQKSGAIRGSAEEEEAAALAESVLGGESVVAESAALRLLVAIGAGDAAPKITSLVADESLEESRRVTAAEALSALEVTGEERRLAMIAALSEVVRNRNSSDALRSSIVAALAAHWCAESRDALVALFRNPANPAPLRVAAMEAVAPRAVLTGPEMGALLQCLADGEDAVSSTADRILAKIRSQADIAILYGYKNKTSGAIAAVGNLQESHNRRQQDLLNLLDDMDGPRRKKKEATPAEKIAAKLAEGKPAERLAAAYDLGQQGGPSELETLLARLEDEEPAVGRAAARGIVSILARHPKASVDSRSVTELLKHERVAVQANAAWLLGRLEDDIAVPMLITRLEAAPGKMLGRVLVEALGRIGEPAGLQPVAAYYTSATDRESRGWAVQALALFGTKAIPHLLPALGDKSRRIRGQARKALSSLAGEDLGPEPGPWREWYSRNDPTK